MRRRPVATEEQSLSVAEIAQRFAEIETGHVADALEHVGVQTPVLGRSVAPLTEAKRFAGPVRTLLLARSRTGTESRQIIDLLEQANEGDVLVVDAQGICDWAIFGDRAGLAAQKAGAVGVVVHGGVRDIDGVRKLGLPVFATGPAIVASEGRLQGVTIDGPVVLDGVLIEAGDWLVADSAGICVVPATHMLEVLKLSEEREAIDRGSLSDMQDGASLRASHRHFHDDDASLQSA
jgi:4-hydroxy-4-methyl-2-oxoglutarate aldolase